MSDAVGKFRDLHSDECDAPRMPTRTPASSTTAEAVIPDAGTAPSLEDELRSAEQDFENGDYIELTLEDLDRCVATGESPWPDASRG